MREHRLPRCLLELRELRLRGRNGTPELGPSGEGKTRLACVATARISAFLELVCMAGGELKGDHPFTRITDDAHVCPLMHSQFPSLPIAPPTDIALTAGSVRGRLKSRACVFVCEQVCMDMGVCMCTWAYLCTCVCAASARVCYQLYRNTSQLTPGFLIQPVYQSS